MRKFSIFSLLRNAMGYHQGWERMWRSPDPRPAYDVIIIGGGGHGLGAAYYLVKEHGLTNVVVLEKCWLGGGNTARNTMTIRLAARMHAWLIAKGEPHHLIEKFGLDRFDTGRLVFEGGVSFNR